MEILNHQMIKIFKYLGLLQLGLFIFLFVLVLCYRIYQEALYQHKKKLRIKIIETLKETSLSNKDKLFLSKNLHYAIFILHELEIDQALVGDGQYQRLLTEFFLAYVKDFSQSKYWYIRQLACYLLYLKAKFLTLSVSDQKILMHLLEDDTPVVAMNAVRIVGMAPNEQLINRLLDIFAHSRRVQYDLFRILLTEASLNMAALVIKRLGTEQNPQTRGLCYRMLIDLPKTTIPIPNLTQDIDSDYLDLSLAALAFCVYARQENFEQALANAVQSPIWQIRARAAKLIGKNCKDTKVLLLQPLLNDENTWVRFRAAEALVNLGKIGIDLLQSNPFPAAIERAKEQLILIDKHD